MPTGVLAAEEYVALVDHSMGWSRRRLQVLDAATGQLRWQVTDLPNEWSLAADQVRLFIAVAWNIRAYNLSDGKLLWRTPGELPGHTGYWIYPTGGEILVYSMENSYQKSEQVIRTYNALNGTLSDLSRITVTLGTQLVFRSRVVDYWTDSKRLWVTDRSSSRTQWQVKVNGGTLHYWPVLTDSIIILPSAQFSGGPIEVYAADIRTGAIVWQYAGKCWSNLVMVNNTIYAVREDTAIVGIDPQTGREVGSIRFATTKAEANTQYWVAATGNKVFSYFGDSQELIAFAP